MKEWIIFGVLTVFLFPLVTGLLFMITYMLHTMIYREKGLFIFEQRDFYLYFLFLLVFFVIIFFVTIHTGVINRMGLRLPTELTQLVMLGIGILIGIGLYYFEFYSTIFFKTISKYIPFIKQRIFMGSVNVLKKSYPKFYILILLSIGISFCEEFIWRGFLITVLKNDFSLTLWSSIMLSSLFFGLNHYYFGLQTIILKVLAGIVFGILYISTYNILIPFASHTAFNIWVWRKLIIKRYG